MGRITLIDLDHIAESNLNRQIHALESTLGQAKVEAMAERIRLINPECQVELIDDFLEVDNLADYLGRGYSAVIDAIDSVKTKTALVAWCRRNKIKLITCGGAGGQLDPTQIQIADLASETIARHQTVSIGANETVKAMAGRNKTVGGSESITIGGSRNLKVGSSHLTNVGKNRKLSVGAAMIDTTLGNVSCSSQNASVIVGGVVLKVSAASITEDVGTIGLQTIGGIKYESAKRASALEVQKKYREMVGGMMALTTQGKYIDNAETTSTWTAGGEIKGEAPEIWIEAIKEIRIKCGASMITILPESIAFTSTEIDLSGATLWAKTGQIHHN